MLTVNSYMFSDWYQTVLIGKGPAQWRTLHRALL